jgi:hypothetical protein
MDARFSKVIPTASGQSIELIADLFNVLNLIDGDWGVRRFIEETRILTLVGYDAPNGRGIYKFNTQDPSVRDPEATRWRMQLGARYTF